MSYEPKMDFECRLPSGEVMRVSAKRAIGAQYKAAMRLVQEGAFTTQSEAVDHVKVSIPGGAK